MRVKWVKKGDEEQEVGYRVKGDIGEKNWDFSGF